MQEDIEWGPIVCTSGKYKGRIGYYDDDDILDCDDCEVVNCLCSECEKDECNNCNNELQCPERAIVYWGDMLYFNKDYLLEYSQISNQITMDDLFSRKEQCFHEIYREKSYKNKYELLNEIMLIEQIINNRYFTSRYLKNDSKRIFISHAKEDAWLAARIHSDLSIRGHNPWSYEFQIKGGENIPKEIQEAIDASDYLIVILSPNAVESNWVETEWLSLFWDEVNTGKIKVIPVLAEQCDIPRFLKNKKYINFIDDYNTGLFNLINSFS